ASSHERQVLVPRTHLRNATAPAGARGEARDVFHLPPYIGDSAWRRGQLREIAAALTRHHYEKCAYYRNILTALNVDPAAPADLVDLPFLPVGLFKRLALVSVPPSEIHRTLTSSGTRGSAR